MTAQAHAASTTAVELDSEPEGTGSTGVPSISLNHWHGGAQSRRWPPSDARQPESRWRGGGQTAAALADCWQLTLAATRETPTPKPRLENINKWSGFVTKTLSHNRYNLH